MNISCKVEGVDNIISNIAKILPQEQEKMNQKVGLAGEALEYHVRQQAELIDEHTIPWLTEHDHPYSNRYPTNYGPHGDDTLVHIQSGRLFDNIERHESIEALRMEVEVGVSREKVDYISDLIYGSWLMRPRNFLSKGFEMAEETIKGIIRE